MWVKNTDVRYFEFMVSRRDRQLLLVEVVKECSETALGDHVALGEESVSYLAGGSDRVVYLE